MDWTKINFNNIYQNDKQSIQWMQRQLGVKDDGIIGQQTIKALQRMVGTKDDGAWGNNSKSAATQYFNKFNTMQQVPQNTFNPRSMLQRSSTRVRPFFVPSLESSEIVPAAGMEEVPQVESTQQAQQPKRSRFVENLSRTMSAYGMHGAQNALPIQENPYDLYNGKSSREYIESIPKTDDLDVRMTQSIPTTSRIFNMAVTIPEHAINQFTGRVLMPLAGENGNEIAEAIENAQTPEEKQEARKRLWRVPGFKGATQGEKADITAALTFLNGNKPMTYDDYLAAVQKAGKEPGSWLGSDYSKLGNSYTHMNRAENAIGTKDKQIEIPEESSGLGRFLRNTYNAGVRIWDTPNRGRYGGWAWRVNENGDIEISDAFEATEQQAARGKNDTDSYNEARDSWQRGTTHPLRTTISTKEQARYIKRGMDNLPK